MTADGYDLYDDDPVPVVTPLIRDFIRRLEQTSTTDQVMAELDRLAAGLPPSADLRALRPRHPLRHRPDTPTR